MMAGVGPFAIPLAIRLKSTKSLRKESFVHANDLNPESFKYLNENIQLNSCSSHIRSYNLDGRDFIRHLNDNLVQYTDVIMNLPQSSISFLDVFINQKCRPTIHIYAFSSEADPVNDIRLRIANVLQCDPSLLPPALLWSKTQSKAVSEDCSIAHIVRDVAPKKVMVCLSFQLPKQVNLRIETMREYLIY